MTLHVTTDEGDVIAFDDAADEWRVDEDGRLHVGRLAEFNTGRWVSVIKVPKLKAEVTPSGVESPVSSEGWWSLADIPWGVFEVIDASGKAWLSYSGQTYWVRAGESDRLTSAVEYGPFRAAGE